MRILPAALAAVLALASCKERDGHYAACAKNEDCGRGLVCNPANGLCETPKEVASAEARERAQRIEELIQRSKDLRARLDAATGVQEQQRLVAELRIVAAELEALR